MPLTLAHFPSEILANVFDNLPPLFVYMVTHLSGNRLIREKSKRSISSTRLSQLSLKYLGLKALIDFESLTHLSIESAGSIMGLELDLLPPTLTSLRIHLPSVPWLSSKVHLEDLNDPAIAQSVNSDYRTAFNFKRHFKNLKHLDLNDTIFQSFASSSSQELIVLVKNFLPDTLETLSLSRLTTVHPQHWLNLPPRLLIKSMYGVIDFLFLGRLIHYVPHLRFKHVDFRGEMTQAASLSQLSIETVGLWTLETSQTAFLENLQSVFPSGNLPSQDELEARALRNGASSTPVHASMPYLTLIVFDGHVTPPKSAVQWPASLTEISKNGASNSELRLPLPKTLSSLTAKIWNEHPIFPKLKTLDAWIDINSAPQTSWSPRLTSLTIHATVQPSYVHPLPNSLTSLVLDCPSPQSMGIWLKRYPSALTYLKLSRNSPFSEWDLPKLPPSLTYFVPEFIGISAESALISRFVGSSTTLTMLPSCTLRRLTDGSWMIESALEPSKDFNEPFLRPYSAFAFKDVALPKHLTRLKLHTVNAEYNWFGDTCMPSLTRLKLRNLLGWNWNRISTPSLTRLTLNGSSSYVMADPPLGFPKSVTYLRLRGWETEPSFPAAFAPNLRTLRCFLTVNETLLKKCTALETLEMRFPFGNAKSIDPTFVLPTVTHFTALSLSSHPECTLIASILEYMPNLEHMNVDYDYWSCSTDELKTVSHLKSFECRRVAVSKSDTRITELTVPESGVFDLCNEMANKLHEDWPAFVINKDLGIDFPIITSAQLELLGPTWSKGGMKTFVARNGVQLWKRFGQYLPSTLETLDLANAAPIEFSAPHYLPSSLTDLKIDTSLLNVNSYAWLPRGLVSLSLGEVRKFFKKHALALPPNLKVLHLDFTVNRCVDCFAMKLLPSTLKELKLGIVDNPILFSQGLPPQLDTLYVRASSTFFPAGTPNLKNLPPSLTTFRQTSHLGTMTCTIVENRLIGVPVLDKDAKL